MNQEKAICSCCISNYFWLFRHCSWWRKTNHSQSPRQQNRKSISSSAFAASRRQLPPCHPGFPVLPQSGDISAVFGLVVALHKQLRETESVKKHWRQNKVTSILNLLKFVAFSIQSLSYCNAIYTAGWQIKGKT